MNFLPVANPYSIMPVLMVGIISYGATRFLLPMLTVMIAKGGFVRPNYRQEQIPVAMGLVFLCSVLITGLIGYPIMFRESQVYLYFLAFAVMTLLGLIDDLMGSREASGLKGHFKKLFMERELTTGALKALGGAVVALLVSAGGENITVILVNTLIVALSCNAVNLLDLRPGRAGKGFLVGTLILVGSGFFLGTLEQPYSLFLALVLGSLLAYLPADLKARVMMGDTGSNPLGLTLGIGAILLLNTPGRYIFLFFLIMFHFYTEKYSLTQTIEKNKFLKFLDMLGRE